MILIVEVCIFFLFVEFINIKDLMIFKINLVIIKRKENESLYNTLIFFIKRYKI